MNDVYRIPNPNHMEMITGIPVCPPRNFKTPPRSTFSIKPSLMGPVLIYGDPAPISTMLIGFTVSNY